MQFHPESPDVSETDLSRLRFVADLKRHLFVNSAKGNRSRYEKRVARPGDDAPSFGGDAAARRDEIRTEMEKEPFFQGWSSVLRASQDLMWTYVGNVVDSDRDRMTERLATRRKTASGTVRTRRDIEIPPYLASSDTHRMPGSYYADQGPDNLRAGAVYDLGGAIYQLGIGNKSGGLLNDSRGRALVSHMRHAYPSFVPSRILDMGCAAGHNTVPLCHAFPDAAVHAIDIGAPMVRYAHLRAEGLGATVHFSQQDAERTDFEDGAFDLVVSQILLHETSPDATRRVIAESFRLLRPGGVAVHLEVPIRYEHFDIFDQFFRSWEQYYNNEANISGVALEDFSALAARSGFVDVSTGFQPIPPAGGADPAPLSENPPSGQGAWYIVSGLKPI